MQAPGVARKTAASSERNSTERYRKRARLDPPANRLYDHESGQVYDEYVVSEKNIQKDWVYKTPKKYKHPLRHESGACSLQDMSIECLLKNTSLLGENSLASLSWDDAWPMIEKAYKRSGVVNLIRVVWND